MKTMKSLKLVALLFAFSTLFISCDENNEAFELFTADEQVTVTDTEDGNAEIEQLEVIAEDAFNIAANGRVMRDSSSLCDFTIITHDTLNNTIVIDFDAGCEGLDGRLRTGKITIVYTGDFARDHTGQKTISFDNYTVGGRGVDGTLVIGAWSKNGAGNWNSTRTMSNLIVSYADGSTFTISSGSRNREILQGDLGRIVVLRITGSSTGINRRGNDYITRISNDEPITFNRACLRAGNPYPVAGRRVVQVGNRPELKIDFGNGACDRLAIIQIGDNEPLPIVLGR